MISSVSIVICTFMTVSMARVVFLVMMPFMLVMLSMSIMAYDYFNGVFIITNASV